MCPDEDHLYLFGDFNSAKASLFNIQFKRCVDRPDCKSDEEIAEFLRNKWVMFIYN